jgi:hypothetical protein
MAPLLTRRPGTFSLYVMAPNGAALTVGSRRHSSH